MGVTTLESYLSEKENFAPFGESVMKLTKMLESSLGNPGGPFDRLIRRKCVLSVEQIMNLLHLSPETLSPSVVEEKNVGFLYLSNADIQISLSEIFNTPAESYGAKYFYLRLESRNSGDFNTMLRMEYTGLTYWYFEADVE